MAIISNITNIFFFFWFLIWAFTDVLSTQKKGEKTRFVTHFTCVSITTIVSTFIITLSNLGLCAYKVLDDMFVSYESIILTSTWCLATIVTVYSLFNNSSSHITKWPFVVIVFWCFSSVFYSVKVGFIVLDCFEEGESFLVFRLVSNVVNVVTLVFSIVLCFNGVSYCYSKSYNELENLEEPLLQENGVSAAFAKAGILKRVTFNWLNPLFEAGRAQKLEFSHVPLIPESEMAQEAAFLLEDSIQKQKTRGWVLAKAIVHAVRRSLAINAVFAGMFLTFLLFLVSFSCLNLFCIV